MAQCTPASVTDGGDGETNTKKIKDLTRTAMPPGPKAARTLTDPAGARFPQNEQEMLVAGLDIRVLTQDGEMLRHLTLDPSKEYQGTGLPSGPPKGRYLGTTK